MLDAAACYRVLQSRDPRFDGRFFACVTTTGIYCRPICPARTPKAEHVVFVPSAAAAQGAGFRPCLRCRPERSPELAGWVGTARTVSRALKLIAIGALDHGDVPALSERVGVGERQLRRLFRKHLGASPHTVAATRRALFAKQLVTETALPLVEVASAAGYGSVRRFNSAMRDLYGRTPRELRRGMAGRAKAALGVSIFLPYVPPYDWYGVLEFLAKRAIPGVECVEASESYRRTIALDRSVGEICVRHAENRQGLLLDVHFPEVAALHEIVERVRDLFDLRADPEAISRDLARDPALAPLVERRPGLRVPGAWEGFELAVRALLGQQVTVAGATTLSGRLVARFGTRQRDAGGGLTHRFPSPERLTGVDLRVIGIPRARAQALAGLAQAALDAPGLLSGTENPDRVIPRLREIPGVGDWTAQYIAMRALRDRDAFPAGDIGLQEALRVGEAPRPKTAALRTRAEAWRPWRAYAALHLWSHLGERKGGGRAAA